MSNKKQAQPVQEMFLLQCLGKKFIKKYLYHNL